MVLICEHGLDALRGSSDRIDGVVAPAYSGVLQRFVQQERISGIGCINHNGFATKVGKGIDFRLGNDAIESVVASSDDDCIRLIELDHSDGVISRGVDDLKIILCEALALSLRIR